MIQQ
jgi:hypothetical protein